MLVPVTPGMLVVEAERMEELMLDDPTIETAERRQRNHLVTSISADTGPATTAQ